MNRHTLALLLALASGSAMAAEYADFLRDLAGPYGHYRQSLSLTSSKDNLDKAKQSIDQFAGGWETFAARYAGDAPKPFAGIADYPAKIRRPLQIGRDAQALIKDGKVAEAHAVLEEVRYLLWEMRVQGGINSIADKSNDFHEAMEIILDHAAAAKSAEAMAAVAGRYGAWVSIKWEEQALAGDLGPVRKEFDVALAEGRKAIGDYLAALRSGNAEAVRKLAGPVKNAYKKMWAIDPK